MFDTILGLPVHPLVVHFAVVLLPLSALSLVVLVFFRRWRERYAVLALLVLTAATAATVVAKLSGEALAGHVGTPADHARWAGILAPAAVGVWAVAVIWYVLQWRVDRKLRTASGYSSSVPPAARSGVATVFGALTTLGALGLAGLVGLVGHTGATATWEGKVVPAGNVTPAVTQSATATATQSATSPGVAASGASSGTESGTSTASSSLSSSASSSPSSATTYTLAQIQEHASATSCWSVVNGNVYDLTQWISQHPGGNQVIEGLCGKDGTSAFNGKHATDVSPNNRLESFRIGLLTG